MAPQIGNDLDQILKDKFTTEFRKEYTTVQGVCLPKKYEDFAQIIENFEIRDDDVWICSFPKTGIIFLSILLREKYQIYIIILFILHDHSHFINVT